MIPMKAGTKGALNHCFTEPGGSHLRRKDVPRGGQQEKHGRAKLPHAKRQEETVSSDCLHRTAFGGAAWSNGCSRA